jgi:hypothetical protein
LADPANAPPKIPKTPSSQFFNRPSNDQEKLGEVIVKFTLFGGIHPRLETVCEIGCPREKSILTKTESDLQPRARIKLYFEDDRQGAMPTPRGSDRCATPVWNRGGGMRESLYEEFMPNPDPAIAHKLYPKAVSPLFLLLSSLFLLFSFLTPSTAPSPD